HALDKEKNPMRPLLTPDTTRRVDKLFQNKRDVKPTISSRFRTARLVLLVLFTAAVGAFAALPGSSAAPAKNSSPGRLLNAAAPKAQIPLRASAGRVAPLGMLFFTGPETVSTFAAGCATPKTDWSLGETVCATVSGVPATQSRKLVLINPDSFVVGSFDVSPTTASYSFPLPSDATGTIGDTPV